MSSSMLMPHKRYSYVKSSDGEGGFTKQLTYQGVLYGSVQTYDNSPVMVVRKNTEIKPEDIVGVVENGETAYYEVKSVMVMGAAQHKRAMLNRLDRPIRPVPSEEIS